METREELMNELGYAFFALNTQNEKENEKRACSDKINSLNTEVKKWSSAKPDNSFRIIVCIGLFAFTALIPICIFGFIAALIWTIYSHRKEKNEISAALTRAINNKITEVPKLEKRMADIDRFVFESAKQWETAVAFLPPKYRELEAVAFMYDAVDSLRADTLKEAINLYEVYLTDQVNKHAFESAMLAQQSQIAALQGRLKEMNDSHINMMKKMHESQKESNKLQQQMAEDIEKMKNEVV